MGLSVYKMYQVLTLINQAQYLQKVSWNGRLKPIA